MPEEERKLTDADIDAIVDRFENKVAERFYGDLGRGVWGVVWKAIVAILVGFAAYGSMKGMK